MCVECRPRDGCFRCGDPGHAQRGCPFGPAFDARGVARAGSSKAFALSGYVAVDEVEEEFSGDIGLTTNNGKASNEQVDWGTLASPLVIWLMKPLKPSSVAVVTPVNGEEGPCPNCRGDPDVRQSTAGKEGTMPSHGQERSDARRQEIIRKRSPSRNREDLRRRLDDS